MGVDMNPVTSGPKVNESLETNIEGVICMWKCNCTYMTWLTLYLKKPELPEEMLLNM